MRPPSIALPGPLRLARRLAALPVLATAIIALQGCTTITRANITPPFFSPSPGTYTAAIAVSIADTNPQAVIHYTLDGSAPTAASPIYTSPLNVATTTTIQAIAVLSVTLTSNPASGTYTISLPQAATPVFNPPASKYATPQMVTISDATPNATIYYTTDGSTPTSSSTVFTTPISVDHSLTLEAVAIAPGFSLSNVATADYTIGAGFGTWTWMGGGPGSTASYGTLGVPDPANLPIPRAHASSATDPAGNFWLFGGEAHFSFGSFMNDLWEYSPATNQWTWQSGSQNPDQPSTHVASGVADPSNMPGGRSYAYAWTDPAGNFWLFGGGYSLSNGQGYDLNDLWKFDPSTHLWTWYSGNPVQFPLGVYGVQGVPAPTNIPGGHNGGAAWTDGSGNLWLFGGGGVGATLATGEMNDLWKYTPSLNEWTWMGGSTQPRPFAVYGTQGVASPITHPGGLSGAMAAADSSYRLRAFGGGGENAATNGNFLNTLWQYDPSTSEWTWIDGPTTFSDPGVYGIKGIPAPQNLPPSRGDGYAWSDPDNNFWVFGGDVYSGDYQNDLWKFSAANGQWIWMNGLSGPSNGTTYGILGVPDPANVPGGREAGVTWVDKSGNLWLFSGQTNTQFLNELWRYQP